MDLLPRTNVVMRTGGTRDLGVFSDRIQKWCLDSLIQLRNGHSDSAYCGSLTQIFGDESIFLKDRNEIQVLGDRKKRSSKVEIEPNIQRQPYGKPMSLLG